MKQFLFLLAFMPLIFACSKDDVDYRDQYEGVYNCDVTGSIILTDAAIIFPVATQASITVKKSSTKSLALTLGGETMLVVVDENGNLTIPSESGTLSETDPVTGATVSLNLTVTAIGTITNRTLYIKESNSGTASYTLDGETVNSAIGGNIVYNGTKK